MAERWDGKAWVVQKTPNPRLGVDGAEDYSLDSVSCSSAMACTAVGSYPDGELAERWNGTTWDIQKLPSVHNSTLDSVSCSSAKACTAVGYYTDTNGSNTLAERWNGTAWAVQETPNPRDVYGHSDPLLDSVSCSSATACTAVGYYEDSNSQWVALAERWNGTTWAIQKTPDPTDARGNRPEPSGYLEGVSCSSARACAAVGYYESNGVPTLAERWNGTTWAIQKTH